MPAPPTFAYPSPAEFWYWNGVPLQSANGAWNLATLGGSRFGVPTLRGQDVPAPYRAGQAWRAKWPDERTMSLIMWADGQGTPTQYPAPDGRLAFNNNIQQLRQMFWTRGLSGSVQGQLQRNWYLTQSGTPQLVTSTAMAEIAGSMDLTMNGRTDASFTVDLLLSDPYFYGVQQTRVVTTSQVITGLGEGIVGEGYPSPVNSFTIAVSGPCTIANGGVSLTFAGAATFPVTIDVLNATAVDHNGANWVSGVTHAGSRMWMGLVPGAQTVTVSNGQTATFRYMDCYI